MNALAPIAPPAGYCDALRIAWHSTDPAEVMYAHCAALDELLANPADLASLAGRGRLTALAETLRAAAPRFAPLPAAPLPRTPQAFALPARTTLPHGCQRGALAWVMQQECVFRPLVQRYGQDAEYLRAAIAQVAPPGEWTVLPPQELAMAITASGYDERHLAAIATALRNGPLARRQRTASVLGLLAATQDRLA
jgi:hypothetical protein